MTHVSHGLLLKAGGPGGSKKIHSNFGGPEISGVGGDDPPLPKVEEFHYQEGTNPTFPPPPGGVKKKPVPQTKFRRDGFVAFFLTP